MDLANTAPLGIALLGLALGMRHATDPDHVVAVTTIVAGERRITAASTIGLVWGLGHTLTVLAVGVAIILFKISIPARLGLAMEFAVAIVLILLGVRAATEVLAPLSRRLHAAASERDTDLLVHSHRHSHGALAHAHPHVHGDVSSAGQHNHLAAATPFAVRRPFFRAFGVGLVHGLAGSAAIALLVLSAIPDPRWAVIYLIVFGIGTMAGMVLITTAIGLPYAYAARRAARTHRVIAIGSGLLSFGFGLFLAYQIGIVDGLFRASVHWTPH
ncbi:MAG: high-affinity nickel-transport family protein [Pseudomonadota bacterium]